MDTGELIRAARHAAGLTQAELARRAAVSQPNIATYENGRVSPSVATLDRLLRAAGHRPVISLEPTHPCDLSGPIGQRVRARRKAIRAILTEHGATRARIFGSVARGEEHADSDLDMLVAMPQASLVRIAGLRRRLSETLDVPVDVTVPAMLRPEVALAVERDAVAL